MPKKKRIIFQGNRAAKGAPRKEKIRAKAKRLWRKDDRINLILY